MIQKPSHPRETCRITMPDVNSSSRLPLFEKFDPDNQKWSTWTKRLDNYFTLQGVTEENLKKSAILSFCGGPTFTLLEEKVCPDRTPGDLSYKDICDILREAYEPAENIWSVRFRFREVTQGTDSLNEFECKLRRAAVMCGWTGESLQVNLVEQFLKGMQDKTLREAILLKCSEDTFRRLDTVVTEALALHSIRNQSSSLTLAKINYQERSRKHPPRKNHQKIFERGKTHQGTASSKLECYRCGDASHLANECKYKKARCSNCKRTGHLARACKSDQRRLNLLQDEPFYALAAKPSRASVVLSLFVNNHPVKMEVDTGTAVTTISLAKFRALCPEKTIIPNDIRLRPADGSPIEPAGYAEVDVNYAHVIKNLKLYVMEPDSFPSLVGRDWLSVLPINWHELFGSNGWNLSGSAKSATTKEFNQIKNVDYEASAKALLGEFENLTKEGIGCIPSTEARLELIVEDPSPMYVRARPIAHSIIDITNKELDFLQENEVIQKINTSEWAHPMVVVPRAKGKKVRLCGDFKNGINRFIKTDEHPLKNIRHALDNIGNGLKFTKLDISSAFLHMPIREADRKYLVINTHRGLYRFNRMTNGLCNAPAIWQRFIESVLGGIDGVEVVMDDIIITGATNEEHFVRLREVFSRLNKQDIRLNPEKCEFFKEAVTYCGFVLRHQQIYKCDDKVRAIKQAPAPSNVTELRAFLGIIQFYASFAPKLADLAHPLYKLLKQNTDFKWTEIMQESFDAVKRELCSDRIIVPFDPAKPLILATDASPTGISAVLSHKFPDDSERPIAYFSRALTETERKYTQIDKEALGIKTGVERFFYYLFGRRFVLITDSRPLVQIFHPQKSLPPLSATRMQHYAIYLLGFTFDIVYRRTDKHQNADALSRLPVSSDEFKGEDGLESFLVNYINESPVNVEVIKEHTRACEELRQLLTSLKNPHHGESAPRFFGLELSEFSLLNDAVILRGHRVVIPKTVRKQILTELHEGHYGDRKMKELARRHVWWPGIDKDIKAIVRSCNACLTYARNPPKEALHPWHPCKEAFERIHLDYAGPIDGKYILLIVDAYSKWLEAFITNGKTTKETLHHVRETVARFGLPKVLVTDNDPTFASDQMRTFCKENGIRLMHSPPFHPASNGQAERFVAVMKSSLKKLSSEGGDLRTNLQRFLFRQRMVESSTGETPAARMIGRQLRSRLDCLRGCENQTSSFDENSKFEVNQPVMVRDYRSRNPTWIPGRIKKQCGTRICEVNVPNGVWKRHFEQMRPRSESSPSRLSEGNTFLAAAAAAHNSCITKPSTIAEERNSEGEETFESAPSDSEEVDAATTDQNETPEETQENPDECEPVVRRSQRENKGVPPKPWLMLS